MSLIKHQTKFLHPLVNKRIFKLEQKYCKLLILDALLKDIESIDWPDNLKPFIHTIKDRMIYLIFPRKLDPSRFGVWFRSTDEQDINYHFACMKIIRQIRKKLNIKPFVYNESFRRYMSQYFAQDGTIITIYVQTDEVSECITIPIPKQAEETLCGEKAFIYKELGYIPTTT